MTESRPNRPIRIPGMGTQPPPLGPFSVSALGVTLDFEHFYRTHTSHTFFALFTQQCQIDIEEKIRIFGAQLSIREPWTMWYGPSSLVLSSLMEAPRSSFTKVSRDMAKPVAYCTYTDVKNAITALHRFYSIGYDVDGATFKVGRGMPPDVEQVCMGVFTVGA